MSVVRNIYLFGEFTSEIKIFARTNIVGFEYSRLLVSHVMEDVGTRVVISIPGGCARFVVV